MHSFMVIGLVVLTLTIQLLVSCALLGPNLISQSSKKQFIVSDWSVESQYHSLSQFSSLLRLFGLCTFFPSFICLLRCRSALQMASNPVFHACTKHIELDYHISHEHVRSGSYHVHSVCSFHSLDCVFLH